MARGRLGSGAVAARYHGSNYNNSFLFVFVPWILVRSCATWPDVFLQVWWEAALMPILPIVIIIRTTIVLLSLRHQTKKGEKDSAHVVHAANY